MKFPTIALSAIGASLAMLSSAPAFAAAHAGKPMDSAASAAMKDGKTRSEVKATRDAAAPLPAGENVTKVPGQIQTKAQGSDTTRAEVKATRDAAAPLPAGENVTKVPGQVQTKGKMSDTSRAEVKAKTADAKSNGMAVPAGEATSKAQQKGQKQ